MKSNFKKITGAGILGAAIPISAQSMSVEAVKILVTKGEDQAAAKVITDQPDSVVYEAIDNTIKAYRSLLLESGRKGIAEFSVDEFHTDEFTMQVLELKSLQEAYERIKREEGSGIDFSVIGTMPISVDIYMATGVPNKIEF